MFDIIFSFIVMYVRSLNYIYVALNMFKEKRKEAVVFDIFWYRVLLDRQKKSIKMLPDGHLTFDAVFCIRMWNFILNRRIFKIQIFFWPALK